MKRITIEIPDGYDDALSITTIGYDNGVNISTHAVELDGHHGDTLVLNIGVPHKWIPNTYEAYSKYCDDGGEFYE